MGKHSAAPSASMWQTPAAEIVQCSPDRFWPGCAIRSKELSPPGTLHQAGERQQAGAQSVCMPCWSHHCSVSLAAVKQLCWGHVTLLSKVGANCFCLHEVVGLWGMQVVTRNKEEHAALTITV